MSSRLLVERDVMVPMADGTELATDIYRNEGSKRWPVLLQRVAYNKDRSAIANGALELRRALDRGYAVCVQEVRGRFRSGGEFVPFYNEGPDGADTVAWLSAASWSEGPIAMFGRSYSAALQWAAADELAARSQLDLLGALSPCMGGWDVPQGWLIRNGVFQLGFVAWWAAAHLAPSDLARRYGPAGVPSELAGAIEELFWTLDAGPASHPSLPYLGEWLELGRDARSGRALPPGSPSPNGSVSSTPPKSPRRAEVPALHIAGWYDVFAADTIAGFTEMAALRPDRHHLVVGPWAHGGAMTGNFAERSYGLAAGADAIDLTGLQLDFFDRWLGRQPPGPAVAGAGASVPVRSFVTGRDCWVELDEWPPPDTDMLSLFPVVDALHGTTIAPRAPVAMASWSFRYDPSVPTPTIGGCTFLPGLEVAANAGPRDQRVLLARGDGVTFQTEPLASPLEVVGTARCSLEVRIDVDQHGKVTDDGEVTDVEVTSSMVVVTISDVLASGRVEILAHGAQQFDAPSLDGPATGRRGEILEIPDQVTTTAVSVDIGPLHHVLGVGHRLCLHVAAASYPVYDRLAATGGSDHALDITVVSAPTRPVVLRLPIVVLPSSVEADAASRG